MEGSQRHIVVSSLRRAVDYAWVTVATCLIVYGVANAIQPGPALEGDPIRGHSLYQDNCTRCHAADGSGGLPVGDATSSDVRWTTLGATLGGPGLIRQAMLAGLDGTGNPLDAAMPRFQGHLRRGGRPHHGVPADACPTRSEDLPQDGAGPFCCPVLSWPSSQALRADRRSGVATPALPGAGPSTSGEDR